MTDEKRENENETEAFFPTKKIAQDYRILHSRPLIDRLLIHFHLLSLHVPLCGGVEIGAGLVTDIAVVVLGSCEAIHFNRAGGGNCQEFLGIVRDTIKACLETNGRRGDRGGGCSAMLCYAV